MSPRALHDALNLGDCASVLPADALKGNAQILARAPAPRGTLPRAGQATFYIAPGGSDANAGTMAAPFESFPRAAAAAREAATKPVQVLVRGGKYYFNDTFTLGPADRSVHFAAYRGEHVTLSGGTRLALQWSKYKGGIYEADVTLPAIMTEAERAHWAGHRGKAAADPLPPAPAGWTQFPGACMNRKDNHNCADAPDQLPGDRQGESKCPGTLAACLPVALARCKATAACQSVSIRDSRTGGGGVFEMFALTNWSTTSNSAWVSYAKDSGVRPPPAPPAPPAPHPPHPPHPSPHPRPSPPGPSPPHSWGPPPARLNTLHVNGVRQVRARFPNGNPQDSTGLCFSASDRAGEGCPGYLGAHGGSGELPAGPAASTVTHDLDRRLSPTLGANGSSYGTFKYGIYDPPEGHPVYNKPLPGLGWRNNSLFSFWRSPFARPGGVSYGGDINTTYGNPSTAVVHMFHGGLWGGWQFQVAGQYPNTSSLQFGYGGYQEARGSGIKHNHYYVDGLMEELDAPGEWFFDPVGSKMYYWPNTTGTLDHAEVVAPLLSTIVRVNGSNDVTFSGFDFTETRATYLDQYDVPSGGVRGS